MFIAFGWGNAQAICDQHLLTCDEALIADPLLDLLRNIPWIAFCVAIIMRIHS